MLHVAMRRMGAATRPAPVAIFGATGSVGTALTYKLAAAGRPLHLVWRNEHALRALASQVGATHTVWDVLQEGYMQKVVKDCPKVGGLAYCVGDTKLDQKEIQTIQPADLDMSMRLNVYGAVQAVQYYQEALKEWKGSAVLFSSVAAAKAATAADVEAPTKSALEGLTKKLWEEMAPNVRVNCVAPSLSSLWGGRVPTPEDARRPKDMLEEAVQNAQDADAAGTAYYLLGPEAELTGEVVADDGSRMNVA